MTRHVSKIRGILFVFGSVTGLENRRVQLITVININPSRSTILNARLIYKLNRLSYYSYRSDKSNIFVHSVFQTHTLTEATFLKNHGTELPIKKPLKIYLMQNLNIVHENNDYIVVNKAAGLISEKSSYEDCTVETQVLNHFLKSKSKPYIGVIHRLDRVTSGVLIFAKKKSILVAFNNLFSSRQIQKTYLAIVKNKPVQDNATLNHFLVKNRLEKRADIVESKSKEAQECSLSYKVIGENEFGYLLEVHPKTGRFHQIRAQLAHIGCPIIGDDKYGSDEVYLPLSVGLHAYNISYQLPDAKELQTFEAPMPDNKFWKFKASH